MGSWVLRSLRSARPSAPTPPSPRNPPHRETYKIDGVMSNLLLLCGHVRADRPYRSPVFLQRVLRCRGGGFGQRRALILGFRSVRRICREAPDIASKPGKEPGGRRPAGKPYKRGSHAVDNWRGSGEAQAQKPLKAASGCDERSDYELVT